MNKVHIAVWAVVLLCLWPVSSALAQQDSVVLSPADTSATVGPEAYLSQFREGSLLEVTLPPLELLLEAGLRNSPNRAALQKNIDIRRSELKTANLEWLRYFGPVASYGISNSSNLSTAPDIFAPQGQMYRTSQTNYYSIGVSLTLPLHTIMDWGNKIKLRKANIRQAEDNVAQYEQDLKLQIISFYNDALLALALLKGKAQALELASANNIAVEIDFALGKVGTESLTLAKQNQMRLMDEFENTKAKLRVSLMTLEILCGMKMYEPEKSYGNGEIRP